MNTHRIHRVAKLTGLSKDVIRVWEKRYDILKPMRGPNRYRLYTDEDVALLRFLKKEMDKGASIGSLADLGREELIRQMRESSLLPAVSESPMEKLINELMDCLKPFDPVNFEKKLNGSVAVIPFEDAMFSILLPLQERVGQLWHDGQVEISIEHYVTKQVQQKIFTAMNQFKINEEGPTIVVGCPPGETHEIGAQSVAYFCRLKGCRVYYLGGDVPVSSLAGLCRKVRSDLVLLSISVPNGERPWRSIIEDLSKEVLPLCPIWVGGSGAEPVRHLFEENHIPVLQDFERLEKKLFTLTKKPG